MRFSVLIFKDFVIVIVLFDDDFYLLVCMYLFGYSMQLMLLLMLLIYRLFEGSISLAHNTATFFLFFGLF